MKLDEIKEEFECQNNIKIEQISRIQNFDKTKNEKVTQNVLLLSMVRILLSLCVS